MLRALVLVCSIAFPSWLLAAEFTTQSTDTGVTVNLDGKLFTQYVIKSKSKPILYPIIGPTGKGMTRDWPMGAALPGEKTDHPHHRSFWFTHGDVNGIDFWAEEGKGKYGTQVHKEFVKVAGGPVATIVSRTDWMSPDNKKVCADERTIVCGVQGENRYIDFTIKLLADAGDVTFGDTKEGSFGVRVLDSMRVDSKKGGHIVTSEGKTDAGAWAQPAAWVDYTGPVDGDTVGIAIFTHPSSFRYPNHWHVRTYGLYAVNPFGSKDFKTDKQGAYTLKTGDSISLRYRVLLHKGADEKKVAAAWDAYKAEK